MTTTKKTEHFKAHGESYHTSAIADPVILTAPNINWGQFKILVTKKTDFAIPLKQKGYNIDLKSLNVNVDSEKLDWGLLLLLMGLITTILWRTSVYSGPGV